ncbi:Crp/Fnr family transcriptional regulator [Nitrosovibrio sp. Nv17]|uniref:Crp/Fnr family transcriptional regulator n=1 Tax=Nitrosovibrio sp. Nv17 TaxID=1855339 RepID=UPI00090889E8|nr:Crp/Fnr family transcriptional regulator [Nitrosovibrio sp. Nv17]SFW16324.1 transcriptional regulator, Crp/Fnr family [Nitrosovibrio sp. Nv17]
MPGSYAHRLDRNELLAALPATESERLALHLESVEMPLGDMLHEHGGQPQYVYFPVSSILSMHYILENGASSEIASIGNEGMLGVSLLMGSGTLSNWATVQTAGHGYRMRTTLMLREFHRGGTLQHVLLRYIQTLMTQISQTAVCNRHHTIEQQLCRWLLLMLDRLGDGDLTMTQELIASMLGVRREGITEAAGRLQHANMIRYRRGHIQVLDRKGLERHVCECYHVMRKEFDRLSRDIQRLREAPARSRFTRHSS